MSQYTFHFDEEAAVKELQERGYRVIKVEFKDAASVSTIKDLIDYFYACRLFYNPGRTFPVARNLVEDRKYLSTFVRKRQQTGLSKKMAVKEAAVLIDTLFRFEKHLKLKEPVMSPRALDVSFIMDRVCAIASQEIAEANEADTERFINEINEVYSRKYAERDAERAAASRKRILRRIHGEGNRNAQGCSKRD